MKEIKGDKNVTTCTESKYTLEFDKNFTGNIVITMTPPNIGFFKESLEAGRPSSFMNTYALGKRPLILQSIGRKNIPMYLFLLP